MKSGAGAGRGVIVLKPDRPIPPVTLDYAREDPPARWRNGAAVGTAVVGGSLAGFTVIESGIGWCGAWAILNVLCPVVACRVASSRHLLVALLSATSMMGAMWFHMFVPEPFFGNLPEHRRSMIMIQAVITIVSLLVAAGIGVSFARKRRAADGW